MKWGVDRILCMRYDATRYVVVKEIMGRPSYLCLGGETRVIFEAEMFKSEGEARDVMQSHGINFEHYEVRPIELSIEDCV